MSVFTLVKSINNNLSRIHSLCEKINKELKWEDYEDLPPWLQEKMEKLEKEVQSLDSLFKAHIENNKFILQMKVQNNMLRLLEDLQDFSDLTLDQSILKILDVVKKGLSAIEITKLLLRYGYKTNSSNLYPQVRLNLHLLKKNEGAVYSTDWGKWFITKRSLKIACPHERLRKTLSYINLT